MEAKINTSGFAVLLYTPRANATFTMSRDGDEVTIKSETLEGLTEGINTVIDSMKRSQKYGCMFGFYVDSIIDHLDDEKLLKRLKEVNPTFYNVLSNEQYDGKPLDSNFIESYTDDELLSAEGAILKQILNSSFALDYSTQHGPFTTLWDIVKGDFIGIDDETMKQLQLCKANKGCEGDCMRCKLPALFSFINHIINECVAVEGSVAIPQLSWIYR